MKKLTILLLVAVIMASCSSTYKCYPSKRSRDYAVVLKGDGDIKKDHRKTMLVSVTRTMKGYKHLFIADTGDTITLFFPCQFDINQCYYVHKRA